MSYIRCYCASEDCLQNGCKLVRQMNDRTVEMMEPRALPGSPPIKHPPAFSPAVMPKGCICPPGSEKTCERYDCGRKTMSTGGAL